MRSVCGCGYSTCLSHNAGVPEALPHKKQVFRDVRCTLLRFAMQVIAVSSHAAFIKAAEYFNIRLVRVRREGRALPGGCVEICGWVYRLGDGA